MLRRLCVSFFLLATTAAAQFSPRELTVFGSGGHSVTGGFRNASFLSAGVRLGWPLTREHGPRWLRGNLEYAVDVTPLNLIWQQQRFFTTCPAGATAPCFGTFDETVYGFGFTPVLVKWNFTHGRRVVPYIEMGGGLLFTNHDIPPATSPVNFTPQAGLGVQFPVGHSGRRLDLAFRWVHISNASLSDPNPGFNTIQGRIGLQFRSAPARP